MAPWRQTRGQPLPPHGKHSIEPPPHGVAYSFESSRAALRRLEPLRGAGYLALILSLAACSIEGHKGDQRCMAPPLDLSYQTRVLDVLHVYSGADGVSRAEVQPLPAQESTYLGALLRQYPFGDPSNVVVVSGPPNFHLPRHPAPYREVFILLAGSSVMDLSDGTQQQLHPGSIVLVEDTTGAGHGGYFGPCGYVALDLQFKTAAAH